MPLPTQLIDYVRSGQTVLVLCSGSAGRSDAICPPTERKLTELLAQRFLDDSYKDRALSELIELASSEASPQDVDNFLAEQYLPIEPTQAQLLIPAFVWAAIATTQLDLAIERAYDRAALPIQRCVPFSNNTQPIESSLSEHRSVMYLRLHGSIANTRETGNRLIFTIEQYPTHLRNRGMLFERLETLAAEYPLLILTESASAPDVRAILQRLSVGAPVRPRSYIVAEEFLAADERLLESRKITPVAMEVHEFLRLLDATIPRPARSLAASTARGELPIQKRFRVSSARVPTERLISFLDEDAEFLRRGMSTGSPNPKEFYRGYLSDWAPIEHRLDAARSLTDILLSEAIVEEHDKRDPTFHLVKGHAGSGKSVILRRVAWDAAMDYDCLCLYAQPAAQLSYEPLAELGSLCRERIYLFVDQITSYVDMLSAIFTRARRDHLPLTVIGATTHNAWNMLGSRIEPFVTGSYELRYLSEAEIESLLDVLEKHKSLGDLSGQSRAAQREAFAKRSGRQLLVALHEATSGRAFTEIILNEYRSISSEQARALYLTVCVLHRLGVQTRAGLISRVHGIPFHQFRSELHLPLETVVSARQQQSIHDCYYETRHSHIADIVFEGILIDANARFEEYARLLRVLDAGYSSDRDALRYLINARELRRLFPDIIMIRKLYDIACSRYPSDAALLQQRALFEMGHADGHLDSAAELLKRALEFEPRNPTFLHSMAELNVRRAAKASKSLERIRLRGEARGILRSLLHTQERSSYTYHTLLKIELIELRELIPSDDETSIQQKIKDIERILSDALQRNPYDEYILEAEASFAETINNEPRALDVLRRAFQKNRDSAFIAMRLAKTYRAQGALPSAISTLRECLELTPHEKDVHFEMARCLMEQGSAKEAEILYHLRESFTKGDSRLEAQYWYARALYLTGDWSEANELFRVLSQADISNQEKTRVRGRVTGTRFSGSIAYIEGSIARIKRDVAGDVIFTHATGGHRVSFSSLTRGARVTFQLAFNFRGPIAIDMRTEGRTADRDHTGTIVLPSRVDCDVGILIALKEEFRELMNMLNGNFRLEQDRDLGHHYYSFDYPPQNRESARCVAAMIGEMGQEKAVLFSERFIARWHPELLVVVGISAAIHDDLKIGDVVVATQVDAYLEAAKAGTGTGDEFVLQPGGSVYRAPHVLLDMIKNIEFSSEDLFLSWREKCRRRWAAALPVEMAGSLIAKGLVRAEPNIEECSLASGPVVGAATSFGTWVRQRERQHKALDMESAGAMIASHERADPQPTLILRGISDFGDSRKSEIDQIGAGALRRYAMQNALDLLLAMIEARLLSGVTD